MSVCRSSAARAVVRSPIASKNFQSAKRPFSLFIASRHPASARARSSSTRSRVRVIDSTLAAFRLLSLSLSLSALLSDLFDLFV